MLTNLTKTILTSRHRLAMPLGIYPGLIITGKSVAKCTNDFMVQAEASYALYERYASPILQTALDLTVEAETFGAQVRFDQVIPTIEGRLITSRADKQKLFAPKIGHKRTIVPLSVIPELKDRVGSTQHFVLGSMIGPFSLVARLYGLEESLELIDKDPNFLLELLKMATNFLQRYAEAYRGIGADGVILAEPSAGLIEPQSLAKFSAPFVRQIVESLQNEEFSFIYHNENAQLNHLSEILTDGAAVHHFGPPMDLTAALGQVDDRTILAGNLDSTGLFVSGGADNVYQKTLVLLTETKGRPNFVISTGSDLPPNTRLENLDAFFRAVNDFNLNH